MASFGGAYCSTSKVHKPMSFEGSQRVTTACAVLVADARCRFCLGIDAGISGCSQRKFEADIVLALTSMCQRHEHLLLVECISADLAVDFDASWAG